MNSKVLLFLMMLSGSCIMNMSFLKADPTEAAPETLEGLKSRVKQMSKGSLFSDSMDKEFEKLQKNTAALQKDKIEAYQLAYKALAAALAERSDDLVASEVAEYALKNLDELTKSENWKKIQERKRNNFFMLTLGGDPRDDLYKEKFHKLVECLTGKKINSNSQAAQQYNNMVDNYGLTSSQKEVQAHIIKCFAIDEIVDFLLVKLDNANYLPPSSPAAAQAPTPVVAPEKAAVSNS